MTNTATASAYQLRKSIQQVREADGLGDVRMWNETAAAFSAFMAEYKAEATKPQPRVVFVKQYTNYAGRVFRQYTNGEQSVDIRMRDDRGGPMLLTNAEAKAAAVAELVR